MCIYSSNYNMIWFYVMESNVASHILQLQHVYYMLYYKAFGTLPSFPADFMVLMFDMFLEIKRINYDKLSNSKSLTFLKFINIIIRITRTSSVG